jgi:hypothetical protein
MRYEVTTALTPQEVVERASAHFGPQGFGLENTSRDETCLVFEGGGGYVALTIQRHIRAGGRPRSHLAA